MTPSIEAVEVQNVFASEDWVAGRAQLVFSEPKGARLRVFDAFRIRGGEIVEQENHYDPRPVLG